MSKYSEAKDGLMEIVSMIVGFIIAIAMGALGLFITVKFYTFIGDVLGFNKTTKTQREVKEQNRAKLEQRCINSISGINSSNQKEGEYACRCFVDKIIERDDISFDDLSPDNGVATAKRESVKEMARSCNLGM